MTSPIQATSVACACIYGFVLSISYRGVLEGFLPHLHLEQSEVIMCSKYANERIMSVMVKRPMRRPSSTIGSFLILRSLISLTASRRLVSGCEAMRGVDIMSLTLVILGSLN